MLECTPCDKAHWEFGNGYKDGITKKILTAAYNLMHVNKLIPNLVQSKSYSFRDPKSQSPETDAKLSIRLKKKIKQHYVGFHSYN